MKKAFVKIDWIPAISGGRKNLPEGKSYVAVSKFQDQTEEDWINNAWSIRLEFLSPESGGPSLASYAFDSFLSPLAPDEKLGPESVFQLYEGNRPVARVQVLLSERLIEQLIAHAA